MSEGQLEELADDFFGDQDCEPLDLDSCQRECKRLVRENWPAIQKLADALLEHTTLSGEEIEDLLFMKKPPNTFTVEIDPPGKA